MQHTRQHVRNENMRNCLLTTHEVCVIKIKCSSVWIENMLLLPLPLTLAPGSRLVAACAASKQTRDNNAHNARYRYPLNKTKRRIEHSPQANVYQNLQFNPFNTFADAQEVGWRAMIAKWEFNTKTILNISRFAWSQHKKKEIKVDRRRGERRWRRQTRNTHSIFGAREQKNIYGPSSNMELENEGDMHQEPFTDTLHSHTYTTWLPP